MIDLALLREKFGQVSDLIKRKDPDYDIEALFNLDKKLRKLSSSVEALRAEKNRLAKLARGGITEEIRNQSSLLSGTINEQEKELKIVEKTFKRLYLHCPNIISLDVPEGGKESNKVIRVINEKPTFDFTIKNHVELGKALGWLDFEAATKMSGSNFALYRNDAVKLVYALSMFMLNNAMDYGFSPVLPPYLINEKSLEGSGNFPKFREEVFAIEKDGLYLTPTAEVNLANLHRDSILSKDELPIRMTALTSCFRREAGGYGSSERGLIRIHQFDKIERFSITSPEQSAQEQELMLECAETILKKLGLHYRVSLLAAGDCSFASSKTYDIEVWMPGQHEYKEVSSISNCTDFQSRRCAIRYREKSGEKTKLVHTLNGSSLALPRLIVAMIESGQQSDGTIVLPDVLKKVTLNI